MHQRGFTLVEVLAALGLLVAGALATAQLVAATTRAIYISRTKTSAAALASTQMEKLRAAPSLNPSPSGSLDNSVGGYVDYLDAHGSSLGGGGSPPRSAAYVCRWSIEVVPDTSGELLVLQVLARPAAEDAAGGRSTRGEARLVTVRARGQQ